MHKYPNEGKLVFISKDEHIISKINSALMEQFNQDIDKYGDIFIIDFKDREELREIIKNVSSALNKNEKKTLLCSFYSDDSITVLKNIVTFFALYQDIFNEEIVNLIKHGNLYSVIQPIYNIQEKKLFGYEFLLRGRSNGQNIPPFEIFEVAHELGLEHLLDARARECSIKKASELKNKDNLKVFINFLPSVINKEKYSLDGTFKFASLYEVPLDSLVFEMVETEDVKDIEKINNIFVVYKQNGTRIAMDDVGSGYSSLNNLHKIVPDYVKIDRELIDHCDQNTWKLKIIQSIVNLCKNLNIMVLAEGLERKEELETCRALGIDLAQGYLLGKPSEEEVTVPYNFD